MGELEQPLSAAGIGADACVAALCALAALWTIALVVVDSRQRRLPDVLTLPAAGIAVIACFLAPAGWVGVIWPLGYLMLGPGIGGGDVKLALPLGVALALVGGVVTVFAGMLIASLFTVVNLLLKGEKSAAHGPSMLAAAWIVGLASTFLVPV